MLTFGELFAGVGGFSLGFEQAGWECRWQVEWDRHCQQVLARHWPEVARYGDVRDVAGGDLSFQGRDEHGSDTDRQGIHVDVSETARSVLQPVQCITFGSPCRDLSVAGKRAGLDGARSGLFFEAIRIIKEMRDATAGTLPRFAIWENVAGALSSNKGDDFLAVLDAFAEIGAMDIAWRLVDAQHFGVPQRRRRVFVVADFGGECAGAIHVESAGMRWHPASGGTAGENPAGSVGGGVAGVVAALTGNGVGTCGADDNQAQAGHLIVQPPTVRRLTPLECERLNGFPDHHTRWRADGLEQSDSQRYRQMGNAVAVPCAAWLAWNLTISLQQETT